jgi:hypothetical protein
MREREREAKVREAKRRRECSIHGNDSESSSGGKGYEDMVPQPGSPKNFLNGLKARTENVEEWASRYCTSDRQRQYVIDRFALRMTEAEIAARERVTQQAVSKHIRAGIKAIERGLMRDGVV